VPGVASGTGVLPPPDRPLPTDPKQLEAEIEATRQRLVGTVDELAYRLKPKVLARSTAADIRAKVKAAIRTPDGSLRVERLAAVGTALAAFVSFAVWNRRRRRR
jgi:hypothetical protein